MALEDVSNIKDMKVLTALVDTSVYMIICILDILHLNYKI